jgi:SAM-dependent methyltransferase
VSSLVEDLARATPQQPATVAWRVVELEHLFRHGLPSGYGLDVGCGDGTIVEVVRRHGGAVWQLVGVDPDPAETALAERSGQYVRVHTVGAADVPEPDDSFDFAFSNSVLEHIPDLPSVLREVARVLKPGAPFVATVPSSSFNGCLGGPGVLAPLLGRGRAEYEAGIDARLAHVNLWSPARWESELGAAGLRLETASPYLSRADVRRWERLSNWTGGLLYGLARRRRRPIEIHRAMGLESGSGRGAALARVTVPVVRASLRGYAPAPEGVAPDDPGYGCLLLVARK